MGIRPHAEPGPSAPFPGMLCFALLLPLAQPGTDQPGPGARGRRSTSSSGPSTARACGRPPLTSTGPWPPRRDRRRPLDRPASGVAAQEHPHARTTGRPTVVDGRRVQGAHRRPGRYGFAVLRTYDSIPHIALRLTSGRRAGHGHVGAGHVGSGVHRRPTSPAARPTQLVEATEAHILCPNGAGQYVAIVDSGTARNHEYFGSPSGSR